MTELERKLLLTKTVRMFGFAEMEKFGVGVKAQRLVLVMVAIE